MGECYLTRREKREVTEQLGIYKIGADARPSGVVVIPNKVITLATRVFQNDGNVTNITLPPYLQEIQERAFENCTSLETIVFPQSIQTIHEYAFSGCEKIQAINVPDNIPLLKPYTFGGNNISQLVLKSSFSPKLWDKAYADNHSIKSVDVNCHLISKGCFSGSDIETVIIEDNTKILKERAFENCKKLINLQLNSDLLEIGDYCFYNTNLSKITIPKTIQRIGIYCFGVNDENLPGLKEVIFQDGLKVISQYSFYGTALESVVIPSSIENIGKYAFGNCTKLVDIQLIDGIKQLGMFEGYAFANCSVEKIIIPPSVEKITKYCFSDCTKLTRVQFTTNIEKTKLEEGIFKNCTALNDVVLPDDMLYLGNNMFEKCTSLESIKLPKNLQELGDYCFKGCSKLASLTIPESIKRIGKYCFEDTYIGKIALPRSLMEIEGYAFSGCDNLGTIEFDYFDAIVEIPTKQGLHIIRSNAFADSKVTNLNIPYTIQTIEKDAFKNMVIDTLHIDVIKTQAWLDAVNTWGIKSYKNLIWRQSVLYFNTNVPFFELYVSQNGITEKVKVDTSKQEYIFEPYNEGITLYYYAYAPNMTLVQGKETYSRTQREVYYDFIFEEQAPHKIEFIVVDGDKNENDDGYIIKDAEILSDTIFDDFYYTYHDSIYYVNTGTNISYTVLKSGYGAVYGTIENVEKNETVTITLSKNGYVYIDLRYPFKESTEYLKYLLDNYNFKDTENYGGELSNCIYSARKEGLGPWEGISKGYIKFKTPNDIYAQNTIYIEGFLTKHTFSFSYSSDYNGFYIIVSPTLSYPSKMHYSGRPKDIASNQIHLYNNSNGDYDADSYDPYFSFVCKQKLTNLKPNTIYYILFVQRNSSTYYSDDMSNENQYSGMSDDTDKRGRLFLKRITFNSCPIEDPSLELPTIISGDKVCLYDGVGKNKPFVNSDFFGSPPEYNDIIFQDVFNIDLNNSVYVDSEKDIASNCYGNRLCKVCSIGDSNTGLFDAGIFKMIKPINRSNCSKIKITCVLTHDYTTALNVRAYMYVGQQANVLQPVAKEPYNWEQWTLIGEMSTNGQHALFTCTYDISTLKDEQELFIGVYHGTETTSYTAQCYITEIELQ